MNTIQDSSPDSLAPLLAESESIRLIDILLQGGVLMIPILILSILTIYVIVERWRVLNQSTIQITPFLEVIERHLVAGNPKRAIDHCETVDKPLSRILKSGILRLGRPIRDIEDAIHNAGKKEVFHLQKRMNWLSTIAGVAPLLGFTGTVTGMIRAFMDIQSLQGNVNPSVLAGGIWEALITTAFGLIVGIIAYGFYNYLLGRIDRMVFELENASAEFIDLLQTPTRKKAETAPTATGSTSGSPTLR